MAPGPDTETREDAQLARKVVLGRRRAGRPVALADAPYPVLFVPRS